MATSIRENDKWLLDVLTWAIRPQSILDVGAGAGQYADIIRKNFGGRLDAVEPWEPYVDKFDLRRKYNRVFINDVRHMTLFDYDLVIFGDVFEYMPKEHTKEVWARVSKQAEWGILTIPRPEYYMEFGQEYGNPYEVRAVDKLTREEVMESMGPFANIMDHGWTTSMAREFR